MRYTVAFLVAIARSTASAQQPATREFQPLTVLVSTTPQVSGRPTLDRVLRSISRDLQERIENSSVLRFESLQQWNVRGAPHDSGHVGVRYYIVGEPTTNARGDPAMPPTVEWYVVGPANCPAPTPKVHGTVPMTPPMGDPGDAAPVVAALITTLESIAKDAERCHK